MNLENNILLHSDSYKVTHWKQYPKGTTRVFSFWESRGGQFPEVTFFGLQYLIKKYLCGVVVTEQKIRQAKKYFAKHFSSNDVFNEAGWRHIVTKHGGRLPITIKAVREGTTVGISNVLMTVVNNDPSLPWLTNYLETLLSQVWYTTTVATQSREMKKIILQYLEETGDKSLIDFKLHDFGFRGSTSVESAGIGGAAHLVNFKGTDTLAALAIIQKYYGQADAGFSIPAAEHSTITSWGKENEVKAYKNMLTQYPTGPVAVVSDSYDIYIACEELWGKQLKTAVMNRQGTLIIRPDSGDPLVVIPKVLAILGKAFGYTVNAKGYKVLDPHVRIIQGDGIDYHAIGEILNVMKSDGWSADNIAFGSGGGLLQKVNRDTQKCAFKCSAIEIDGQWLGVMKNPITDPGKRSKAGRLALVKKEPGLQKKTRYETITQEEATKQGLEDQLVTVFQDGKLLLTQTFAEIRARAAL